MDTIKAEYVSKTEFYWENQDNLQILNDQKTFIGVEQNEENYFYDIVIEDISDTDSNYVPIKFSSDQSYISSILIDEDKNCMFTGCLNGILVQYSLDIRGYSRKIIKDYGDLRIGEIISCFRFRNIAVFGGDKSSIAFIDIENKYHIGNILSLIHI